MQTGASRLNKKPKSITKERQKAIRSLFPEVFVEGKINWDRFQLALSSEIDSDEEQFGLTWKGKRSCYQMIRDPPQGDVVPQPEESLNWDTTKNLFYEGDNLDILKKLQKSHRGKIKMIYIDPPYNTGKQFVYADKYSESLPSSNGTNKSKLEKSPSEQNNETAGRYHSNWLNMMFPRLFLARHLLTEDGVIFISIDDHEVHNLRHVLNEIFGEANFVEEIIWKKRSTPPNDKVIGAAHEYILVYAKNIRKVSLNLKPRSAKQLDRYQNPDDHPKGPWVAGDLMANIKGGRYVKSLYFPIVNPKTGEEHYPSSNGNWRFNKTKIEKLLEKGEIFFGDNGDRRPKLKRFLCDVKNGTPNTTLWDFVPLNTHGSMEMAKLFGISSIFDNPKPCGLILELLRLGSNKNGIILDFFSGSCTTAHAVLALNREDGGKRKFIMIQLPEPTSEGSEAYNAGYHTISEIGK